MSYWSIAFKTKMNSATAAIQGSGWGWLGYNPETKKLEIVTTPNQDPLLCMSHTYFVRRYWLIPG
jgi:superoxide dismutase